MMRKFINKGNTLFFTSLLLFLISIGVWVFASGWQDLFATEQTTQCGAESNNPGCYEEEWEATEVSGNSHYYDNVQGDTTVEAHVKIREKGTVDQLCTASTANCTTQSLSLDSWYIKGGVDEYIEWGKGTNRITSANVTTEDGITVIDWGANGGLTQGHLYAGNSINVTEWTINGHVH